MTTNEMIERYHDLYADMASANDVAKMKMFGNAEKWAFEKVAEALPDIAQSWLDKLEAGAWNNYISQSEYEEISQKIENTDGSHGYHWPYTEILAQVSGLGTAEDAPFYNSYALALTINMLYSDHSDSVRTYVREDDIFPFYYALAVDKLKDPDRKNFIRPYFDL